MRSCIDHFEDPFKAVREAWRVLKDQGSLVVGVSIIDKIPIPSSSDFQQPSLVIRAIKKIKNEGLRSALQAIRRRLTLSRKEPIEEDHHLFRFDTDNLKRLLRESGFRIAREHWQKPPHDHCLYIEAVKIQSPNRN
jgi:ubiquinone/menaquinone biosynthesis C-methylase UbiE